MSKFARRVVRAGGGGAVAAFGTDAEETCRALARENGCNCRPVWHGVKNGRATLAHDDWCALLMRLEGRDRN